MPPNPFRRPRDLLALARVSAKIVWRRVRLPSALERATLPELLADLSPSSPCIDAARRRQIARGIGLGEAAVRRLRVVPDTCLFRSLARYEALRRAGVDAVFVLGMRKIGERPEGHAWVEVNGIAYGEAPGDELVRTLTYSPT